MYMHAMYTCMGVTWWVLAKRTFGGHKNYWFDCRRNHYPVCGYLAAPGKCMHGLGCREGDFCLSTCTGRVSECVHACTMEYGCT